ncbi:MAG: DNA polymerase III subunit alpha [Candidatus Latescibacterota bacterium]|nr:MAG: DNA polymerase III subunit alpha [Candidatus Latescibacterota bacterium]
MPRDFVHLHVHSEYSLLDGAIKVEKLVDRSSELGMKSVALTDHGNMFGAVKFYMTARKAGIKPIFGMEAYVTRGSRLDKAKKKGELSQINHLILLARNERGYQNLLRLSSIGYLEGFYYKPRVDMEALEAHSDGLIAMTSCLRGDIPQTIVHSGLESARRKAERLRELFGRDNFYLELQDHGIEDEKKAKDGLIQLSRDTGIPLVATNDAHYLNANDTEAHEVLLCLQTGSDFEDPRRFRFKTSELYFKTVDEMCELFSDVPEAIENTVAIAERCTVELDENTFHLPTFPLPEGFASNSTYLRKLAEDGVQHRYAEPTDEITRRLDYELSVIDKMDYGGYFLIVRDIVNFARDSGIPVGPGRGSAAGSLLCYVLGITDVDPLEQGLLFERMLNPERISMPDIDIDFCFERRDEVIRYVIDRYGADKVCQIITFGTMAARGVVRDVGRVLKIPYGEVDRIAKLIPAQPGTTLDEATKTVTELQRMTADDHPYKRLMELSRTLEGLTRHASIHAAGMIITPTPLMNHLPLYRTNKGEVTSQFDMKSAEAVGLLKIDILGLRTLTVIDKAIRMIERNHGATIDPAKIPLNEDHTFHLLKEARTVGVFQLESAGMRDLLKSLGPESFSDVVAVNALYRPGPLGSDMITTFVDCKHGRKRITYPLPALEPILKETYGVILYQEQVMKIASTLANFSLGEADILRKAMGKKDIDVMSKQRKKFVVGAKQNGISEKKAEQIFDRVEKFASYGFNKSHSAAYAVISVRTAYLKANYPAEFMAANLTSEIDDSDRIMILLEDCREHGIEIVAPDINRCDVEFEVWDGKIYYGLAAVKNVGMNAIKHIVAEREESGEFTSLYDFCSRVSSRMVNRRVVESLIQAGAFDHLPGHRAQKLHNLERTLEMASKSSRDAERGQFALFADDKSLINDDLEDCEEWSGPERLRREKESLGLFLSGHPLDKFKDVLRMMSSTTTSKLKSSSNGKHVVLGGLVSNVKTTIDKKQNPMAFVTFEDPDGQAEAVLFSDVLEKHKQFVSTDRVLLVEGKVSCRNGGEGKLLVNSVMPIDENRPPESEEVHLTIDIDKVAENEIDRLKQLFETRQGQGESRVFFHLVENGKQTCVVRSRKLAVKLDYELLSDLSGSLGVGNIKLVPALVKSPTR